MRQLKTDMNRTGMNILKALNESSLREASAASVKKQINKDKPADAPKDKKDSLVKRTQSTKIPVKSLKEYKEDSLKEKSYGFLPQVFTDVVDKKVKEIKANSEEGSAEDVLSAYFDYIDSNGMVDNQRDEATITKYKEYIQDKLNESSTVSLREDIKSLQDQIADLQDYLDNTPEVSDDERASIQAEIDELLDEVNYQENGLEMEESVDEADEPDYRQTYAYIIDTMEEANTYEELFEIADEIVDETKRQEVINLLKQCQEDGDDVDTAWSVTTSDLLDSYRNDLNESSLTEAPNLENEAVNKMIMRAVKTKNDIIPKDMEALEKMGFKLEPDKYSNGWSIEGPNGKRVSKEDFLGGVEAKFNSYNSKVADYYNLLTKNDPNLKDKSKLGSHDMRTSRPSQEYNERGRYNSDADSYEPETRYFNKWYNKRQGMSRGYDFNDLKNGSKDISNYKKSADRRDRYKAGSWNDDFNKRRLADAEKALSDFQASISDKIARLQSSIDDAKERKNNQLNIATDAEKERKEIIDRRRAERNQK